MNRTVTLTDDQRMVAIVALERYLHDVRRSYEDGLDVGENVDGLRVRRDIIKSTIQALSDADIPTP
jgi:hypothetical protein